LGVPVLNYENRNMLAKKVEGSRRVGKYILM